MGRLFRVVGDRYPVEMEFGGVAAQLQRSHVQMPPATVKHSKDFVGPSAYECLVFSKHAFELLAKFSCEAGLFEVISR